MVSLHLYRLVRKRVFRNCLALGEFPDLCPQPIAGANPLPQDAALDADEAGCAGL